MNTITSLIPHRNPFLFVEKLIQVSETTITGTYLFTQENFFFEGHFPEYPIVPGVILVEAMAQCGGAGVKSLGKIAPDHLFFLATIDSAKFRKPIHCDDRVRFEISNEKITERMIKQSGKVYKDIDNDTTLCAQAQWMCLVGSGQKK